MSNSVYQISHYKAVFEQPLRGVSIHSPSIIQILSGEKKLLTSTTIALTTKSLLLCSANSQWQFINQPSSKGFLSRQFIFYATPSAELIKLSQAIENKSLISDSVIALTKELEQGLQTLAEFDSLHISSATANLLLLSLYQQLAEIGALHKLFISPSSSLKQRLIHYFSKDPSDSYEVEKSAQYLGMSRATLLRKLKQEQVSYSRLLLEVRLSHALTLMQQNKMPVIDLAIHCGYQSVSRFTQRFEQQYGLSPSAYMQTVYSNKRD